MIFGDDAKNSACLRSCSFDFTYTARAFLNPRRVVAQESRHDYSEDRF